jgi:hypothetical protein
MDVRNLSLLIAMAAMFHVTEEFIFPGNFIAWYREFMPPKTEGRGPEFLVWINTLMMFMIGLAMYWGNTPTGAAIWLSLAVVLAVNGGFHLYGVFKLRKYSPGVITGTLLYWPICIVGVVRLQPQGLVSMHQVGIYGAFAVIYHILSARRQAK